MELDSNSDQRSKKGDGRLQVVSQIKPLPEDVEPSTEFREQTRLKLLSLPPLKRGDQSRAA